MLFLRGLRFALLTLPQVTLGGFCLFCHRLPDLLLHWWCRLGGNPSLMLLGLLLHRLACRVLQPVSGGSNRSCDCSLDDSVVVLFKTLLASRALFVVLSSPPAVLDFCGGCAVPYGASSLQILQSRLPFVVSPPFHVSVVLHLLLLWGGLVTGLLPLLLLLCVGLLWGLLRRYVALAYGCNFTSCKTCF